MSEEMKTVEDMKKAGKKPVKKVSLNSFFTREQEDNGVWFQPSVTNADGERMPVRFRMVSTNSDRAQRAIARYQAEMEKIPEWVERSIQARNLLAKEMAECTIEAETMPGYDVSLDGTPAKYDREQVEQLSLQCTPVLNETTDFSRNANNFIVGRTS